MSDVYRSTAEETFCCCLFFFSFLTWSLLSQPKLIWAYGFEKQKGWEGSCGWRFWVRRVGAAWREGCIAGRSVDSPALFAFRLWFYLPGLPPQFAVIQGVPTRYCDFLLITKTPKLKHASECLALQSHCLERQHMYFCTTTVSQILPETSLGWFAEAVSQCLIREKKVVNSFPK